MEHFKEYFTFLQKFDLRLTEIRDKREPSELGPVFKAGYDITHQTSHFSLQFLKRLQILKDLAVIDIIGADTGRRKAYLDQTKKLLSLFNRFWENYFRHYPANGENMRDNFLLAIEFAEIFYTDILEPDKTDVIVTPEFVEDLCDSISEREESLADFIAEITALVKTEGQDSDVEKISDGEPTPIRIRRYPVFVEGIADQFFKIFKEYFEEKDQQPLFTLLNNNITPKQKLLFNSNGNQLADAFKQLIEANLIVSCNKAELESWIIEHYMYVANAQAKPFTAGYLNGIISSDVKICKSPILEVMKNSSTGLALAPAARSKKGSESSSTSQK
ncbi:hypothetical protein [Dyadobacter pollutisoli]|jgi:hypothetical protein|uniref:Uncharacterized protein n=1 Tax=Dyadobacter pollutisoli TaxID=2910158 RepID=A0A9E8SK16_9BACT|nr:hypothetical protein [Dyadobacter pollutisoli]WAC11478.1 hypothetical protein ON006_27575 [Dyadobacter pollutisoli]